MHEAIQSVSVRRREGVATVSLDRPERRNALDRRTLEQLLDALESIRGDAAARVVVVRGAGGAFCTGLDIEEIYRLRESDDEEGFARIIRVAHRVARCIAAEIAPPVLAVVDGPASGGGLGIALACDSVFASNRATFGATQVRLGLHPDFGLTHLLPRRVGEAGALEMLWTGRIIDAHEAHQLGIVDRLAQSHQLETEVDAFVGRLLEAPSALLAGIKRALDEGGERALDRALDAEREAQIEAFRSKGSRELLERVLHRRPHPGAIRIS
jgi:2-(1,2-epoxy-1,2-dihydrophenyl)acetyl-CoA isomerase